jgi:ABC-type lipopolysaccharide export system ATPase subunit
LIVKLAPTSALFAAPKRRRGSEGRINVTDESPLAGLEPATVTMLEQLALRNLDNLGVDHEADFVLKEMQRIFSMLTSALPASGRSEEALRNSIRNALEEM